jgi:Ser/Thr protein kinase RdoA (MazF antagonist)/ribosomal protein S18 acetylase RimI-like enzyme
VGRLRVSVEVEVRAATSDDLEPLGRWNSSVQRVVASTLVRQDRGEALVLLALLGSWPAGHVLVDFTARAGVGAAHLWHMAVHDILRGHRVGSALLARAEAESRARGLRFSELEVEKANPDALRLFRRLGYEIVGEQDSVWPEPDADGELREVAHPCWSMRKALAGQPGATVAAEARLPWAASPSWCPRPGVDPDLLAAVRREYRLDWDGEPADLGGSSNLNLHLPTGGEGLVLRVHRAWVTPARLDALQSIRLGLIARGLPFVEPLAIRSGRRWLRIGEHLAEVERYVAGEDMDGAERLLTGMRLLARVHNELGHIHAGSAAGAAPAANHVSADAVRLFALRTAGIIKGWARTPHEEAIASAVDTLAEGVWAGEEPFRDRLAPQLVHGDFWDNNVRFREARPVAVLDLEFMEERPRIDDLALTLYYAFPSLRWRHGADGALERLAALVRAYSAAAEPALTQVELRALPLAVARTCLHFTRHLALRATEEEQRVVMDANVDELDWGLAVVRATPRWQEAFAG